MIEAAVEAAQMVLSGERLFFVFIGVMVGMVVGILPGLGGTAGMAVLLPFIFGMDRFSAIGLLIGMAAVLHTSDTFPSVLIGVPGSAGSQATIMDGYPLAKQGQARRALGAAFFASGVGGILGAFMLLATLSIARPLVLAMRPPQLLMLVILGLSMVGILSKGSAIVGVLSALLGVILGVVGIPSFVDDERFTFGTLYLWDSVPLAVLALSLFAIPELLDLLARKSSISKGEELKGSVWTGLRDLLNNKGLVLRNSVLGSFLGVIPGIGGSAVDWITYGIAKQTSKDSHTFGTGDIRGVLAPESANNAKEGGALIPTLLFGIPGSGTTAMLLGGLVLIGVQPGPNMVGENLSVTISIVWTLVIANLLAVTLCLGLTKYIAKLTNIPGSQLVPFLLIIITVAAYQSSRHWGDIITLIVLGTVGWLMKHLNWPRAPMLVGFVLTIPMERNVHLSMSLYGFSWLTDPSVIVIGLITVVLLVLGTRNQPENKVVPSAKEAEVTVDDATADHNDHDND